MTAPQPNRCDGGCGRPSRARRAPRGSGLPANLPLSDYSASLAHVSLMPGGRNSLSKSSTRPTSTDGREFVKGADRAPTDAEQRGRPQPPGLGRNVPTPRRPLSDTAPEPPPRSSRHPIPNPADRTPPGARAGGHPPGARIDRRNQKAFCRRLFVILSSCAPRASGGRPRPPAPDRTPCCGRGRELPVGRRASRVFARLVSGRVSTVGPFGSLRATRCRAWSLVQPQSKATTI
jgi:hypothetical protein